MERDVAKLSSIDDKEVASPFGDETIGVVEVQHSLRMLASPFVTPAHGPADRHRQFGVKSIRDEAVWHPGITGASTITGTASASADLDHAFLVDGLRYRMVTSHMFVASWGSPIVAIAIAAAKQSPDSPVLSGGAASRHRVYLYLVRPLSDCQPLLYNDLAEAFVDSLTAM
jgi:hypothetical protein